MQKVLQLVEEIRGLRKESNHRSALKIYSLLENNNKLFLEKLDSADFNHLLRSFESISNTPSKDFGTTAYKDEYSKCYELLMFHLEKII